MHRARPKAAAPIWATAIALLFLGSVVVLAPSARAQTTGCVNTPQAWVIGCGIFLPTLAAGSTEEPANGTINGTTGDFVWGIIQNWCASGAEENITNAAQFGLTTNSGGAISVSYPYYMEGGHDLTWTWGYFSFQMPSDQIWLTTYGGGCGQMVFWVETNDENVTLQWAGLNQTAAALTTPCPSTSIATCAGFALSSGVPSTAFTSTDGWSLILDGSNYGDSNRLVWADSSFLTISWSVNYYVSVGYFTLVGPPLSPTPNGFILTTDPVETDYSIIGVAVLAVAVAVGYLFYRRSKDDGFD